MTTLILPAQQAHAQIPSSPDPTPLRLLAFSVAEAALQSDPNSPSLDLQPCQPFVQGDWVGPWCRDLSGGKTANGSDTMNRPRLWDVVERAKERRVQLNCESDRQC
jgi:hypothetical protein